MAPVTNTYSRSPPLPRKYEALGVIALLVVAYAGKKWENWQISQYDQFRGKTRAYGDWPSKYRNPVDSSDPTQFRVDNSEKLRD